MYRGVRGAAEPGCLTKGAFLDDRDIRAHAYLSIGVIRFFDIAPLHWRKTLGDFRTVRRRAVLAISDFDFYQTLGA
jgi:hypothetical protein